MNAARQSLDQLFQENGPAGRIKISYFPTRPGAAAMDVEISEGEQVALQDGLTQLDDASWFDDVDDAYSLPLSPEIRALARARNV